MVSITSSISGSIDVFIAPLSINPCERLLMSSDVQAKCTNSIYGFSPSTADNLSLTRYSTALTSWLVVASKAFTCLASSTLKPSIRSSIALCCCSLKGGSSGMFGSQARHWNQRSSTRTRNLMSPYSLRRSRKPPVCLAYRPSMGLNAVSSVSSRVILIFYR